MRIRPFRLSDLEYFRIPPFPDNAVAWVLVDPAPIGYAAHAPLPGTPELADLYGFIFPHMRRRGYGSHLLTHLINDLIANSQVRQLAAPVDNLRGATAQFLHANRFVIDHEEWDLINVHVDGSPPTGHNLQAFSPEKAARRFLTLYDDSFALSPWYQPYADEDELIADLGSSSMLLFLRDEQGEDVGFAGIRYAGDTAEIEPFGVAYDRQGEGFGRILLTTLLHHFSQRSIQIVKLSIWANNRAAFRLYRQYGFTIAHARTYLALNIARTTST